MELVSLCGYKFIALCLVTLSQIFAGTLGSYGVMAVVGALYCYFFYCQCKRYLRSSLNESVAAGQGFFNTKRGFCVINCGVQFLLIWYLSYN